MGRLAAHRAKRLLDYIDVLRPVCLRFRRRTILNLYDARRLYTVTKFLNVWRCFMLHSPQLLECNAYVLRAAYLWQNGERYPCEAGQEPPLCWAVDPVKRK